MIRHGTKNNNDVETVVSKSTAETMRVTGEHVQIAPDLLRFGRGRYRALELTVQNPNSTFKLMSDDVHDTVIGRADRTLNFTPAVDLTDFDGKALGVSRRHATLNNQNGLLYITDHTTTNGTYINGKRIEPETPHVLTHGDKLQIARMRMGVHFTDKVLAT